MNDLALQVGHVDVVVVNEPDRPHSGGRQVQGRRRPEPTGTDEQDPGRADALLPHEPHLRHERIAVVALQLIAAQRPQTLLGNHGSADAIALASLNSAHYASLILARFFIQGLSAAVLNPGEPGYAPAPP